MEYFKILIQTEVGNEIILDPRELDGTFDIREWAKLGSHTSNAIINQVKKSPRRVYVIGDYVQTNKINIIQNILVAQRHYLNSHYVHGAQKASLAHFCSIRDSIGQSIGETECKLWGKRGILKSTIKLNTNPPVKGLTPLPYVLYNGENFNKYSIMDLDTETHHRFQRGYSNTGQGNIDWTYNPIIIECLVAKSIHTPNMGILTGHLITIKMVNSIPLQIYKPYYGRVYDSQSTFI